MSSKLSIVTAYYKLTKSKHGHNTYLYWMQNMLENMRNPLIIFTDSENYEFIKQFRSYSSNNATFYIIKDFSQLKMNNSHYNWDQQLELDPEKDIHSKELYIIWNEKLNFIKEACCINPFKSDWFVWLDIGSCRNRDYMGDLTFEQIREWPNLEKLNNLPTDKISFCKTNFNFYPNEYEIDDNYVTKIDLKYNYHVGGLFILNVNIIDEIYDLYYGMIEKYINYNRFYGKDQNILCNCLIAYPNRVNMLYPDYGDPYFYIYQYLR